MIHVTMGSVRRKHKRLGVCLYIPGGWKAPVALVQAEDWLVAGYASYFISCGMPYDKAAKQAVKAVQATYIQGYTKGLREAVARRAAEYAEMWPQLLKPISKTGKTPVVVLQGFDPQAVTKMYVPFQNVGRAGQDYVKGMLAEMGRKANEQQ